MSFLDGAYARLHRAGEHLADLEVREKALTHPEIKTIVAKTDLNTVKNFAITDPLAELPQSFSVLIGETIYNLRAPLDYLVFELAILDSGAPQKGTQFPIDNTEEDFAGHRHRFLKGLSVEHIARIEALQPYKGNYYTAMIRDISNPDKHRKLTRHIPTVAVACSRLVRPIDCPFTLVRPAECRPDRVQRLDFRPASARPSSSLAIKDPPIG